MAKRIVLMFGMVVMLMLLASPNAAAQGQCWFCNATGHGGGNPCGLGPLGANNSRGCFCHFNSATKTCYMSGNPCSCQYDQGAGWLCTCNALSAPKANSNKPTITNIQREYKKWLAIIHDEETNGALKPNANLIFHARSETCIEGGGAFLVGMSLAAAETGHPVKFNFGDSSKDSVQDRIDQGLDK